MTRTEGGPEEGQRSAPANGARLGLAALALIAVAILVLGGGLAIYLLSQDSEQTDKARLSPHNEPAAPPKQTEVTPTEPPPPGQDELRVTARSYTNAINAKDKAAATVLVCDQASPGYMYRQNDPGTVLRVSAVKMRSETFAQVDVVHRAPWGQWSFPMYMEVSDTNTWCVISD